MPRHQGYFIVDLELMRHVKSVRLGMHVAFERVRRKTAPTGRGESGVYLFLHFTRVLGFLGILFGMSRFGDRSYHAEESPLNTCVVFNRDLEIPPTEELNSRG